MVKKLERDRDAIKTRVQEILTDYGLGCIYFEREGVHRARFHFIGAHHGKPFVVHCKHHGCDLSEYRHAAIDEAHAAGYDVFIQTGENYGELVGWLEMNNERNRLGVKKF